METILYETSSEEVSEKRYRNFMFILYPEWDSIYKDILLDIKSNFRNYAYCVHQPESNEKKVHTHLILVVDNSRTIDSICSRLHIPQNLCQPIRGLRGACRYLVHKDSDDKIQYDINDVHVSKSFSSKFFKSFDDIIDDNEKYDLINQFIDTYSKDLNAIDLEDSLNSYVIENDFYQIYRKFYNSIVKKINFLCKKD